MVIKVVSYTPSTSPIVMAFVDIELDGWLRFNGVNFLRDGSLKSAQLTYSRNGNRSYLAAVVIIDQDLRELLMEDILVALRAHVASLPPGERMRPPRQPVVQSPVTASGQGRDKRRAEKSPTSKKALPPPRRLLIGGEQR